MRKIYSLALGLLLAVGMSVQARTIDLRRTVSPWIISGDTLTGEAFKDAKITIVDGATIYLKDAIIRRVGTASDKENEHAGLTCQGDAQIVLIGKNSVNSYDDWNYPAIYVPEGKLLTITGNGSLEIATGGFRSAAIGAGYKLNCGNIHILGGNIKTSPTATGENPYIGTLYYNQYGSAAIGASCTASCGKIYIGGGTIEAFGGPGAPAIGGGGYDAKFVKGSGYIQTNGKKGKCGNITIYGGTIKAYGGINAPGIGSGVDNQCGNILISDVKSIKVRKGDGAPTAIGAALNGQVGSIKVNHIPYTADEKIQSPYFYPTQGVTVDLAEINSDYVFYDRQTLTGKLSHSYNLRIVNNAKITLRNASITRYFSDKRDNGWAGLECMSNATIALSGTNKVHAPHMGYSAIYVPQGSTLTINGNGSLEAEVKSSSSWFSVAAAIGAGMGKKAGKIIIDGGTVTAKGGASSAGIGGSYVTECDEVILTNNVTKVTAVKGEDAPCSIGRGEFDDCVKVTLGDQVKTCGVKESPFVFVPVIPEYKAPTNVRATNTTPTTLTIAWDNPAGSYPLCYKVLYRKTSESNSTVLKVYNEQQITLTDLTPSTTYFVQVCAGREENGVFRAAETKSFSTLAPPCPKATNLVISRYSATSVEIHWDDKEGVDGWQLRSKIDGQTQWSTLSLKSANVHLVGLEGNTKYIFQVGAVCGGSVEEWSEVSCTTEPKPWDGDLSNLDGLTQVIAEDGCVIHGTKYNSNCDVIIREGAHVYLQDVKIYGTYVQSTGEPALTCLGDATIEVLSTGNILYSYDDATPAILVEDGAVLQIFGDGSMEVRGGENANYSIGGYDASSTAEIRVDSYVYEHGITANPWSYPRESCASPYDFKASDITDQSAVLSWKPELTNRFVDSYTVIYQVKGDESTRQTVGNIMRSPFTLTGLQPKTTYEVYLRVNCSNGNSSSHVLIEITTPKKFVPAPSSPIVKYATDQAIWLDWSAGGEETQWRIMYRAKGASGWKMVYPTAHPYKLDRLQAETQYEIKLCAMLDLNDSETWSEYVEFTNAATVSALEGCEIPTNLSVVALASDSVVLSWTPGGNEEAWTIFETLNGKTYTLSSNSTRRCIATRPNYTYTFSVFAVCSREPYVYSKPSEEITVTTPGVEDKKAELSALLSQLQTLYSYAQLLGANTDDYQMYLLRFTINEINTDLAKTDITGVKLDKDIESADNRLSQAIIYGLSELKSQTKSSFNLLLEAGDTDVAKALVANAQAAIDALTWDYTQSLDDNIARLAQEVNAIQQQLEQSLADLRAISAKPDKTELNEAWAEFETLYNWAVGFFTNQTTLNNIQADMAIVRAALINDDASQTDVDNSYSHYTGSFPPAAKSSVSELIKVTKARYDALLLSGDSEACKQLVNDAKTKLSSLAWDFNLSAAENIAILNAATGESIYQQLKAAVEAQRAADNALAPCLAPTGLQVLSRTENSARITWTAGGEETQWVIRYTDGQELFQVPANSNPFTLTDLKPSTLYNFAVRAQCDATNASAWSLETGFVTESHACVNPEIHYASEIGENTALITWTPGSDETKWNLWCFDPNNNYTIERTLTEPYCRLEDLNPNTYYQVSVRAVCDEDKDNYSGWTGSITFTTEPTPECYQITNLQVTELEGSSALVSWTPVSNETKWILSYRTDDDERVVEVNEPSYRLTDLTVPATYIVGVQSICREDNVSAWSPSELFTTSEPLPVCGVPFNVHQVGDFAQNQATIAWNAGENETKWQVEYRAANEEYNGGYYVAEDTPEFTLTYLEPNTTYYVRVSAWCSDSPYVIGDPSTEAIFVTADPTGLSNDQWHKMTGRKILIDGHLFIELNGKLYNAQGAIVK